MGNEKEELILKLKEISSLYFKAKTFQFEFISLAPDDYNSEQLERLLEERPELLPIVRNSLSAEEELEQCNNGLVPQKFLFAVDTLIDFLKAGMANNLDEAINMFVFHISKLLTNRDE